MAKLGSFTVESGKIRITDPCYKKNEDHLSLQLEALNGKWKAIAYYINKRCEMLYAFHEKASVRQNLEYVGNIPVDSGQAGIFDDKYYQDATSIEYTPNFTADWEDDPNDPHGNWYKQCCELTLSEKKAGVIPFGCVASSGYGDGIYHVYIGYTDGKVSEVLIGFI
jgi:hypothetical protein